jgi:tetratricopeptide (TPR) repeat protein
MNDLTVGLLGALLATNQPQAVSNVLQERTGVTVNLAADPVEQDLRTVMIGDDAAQDDVNQWMHEFDALPKTNKTEESVQALNKRIMARFDSVRGAYENFLRKHPNSAHGYLAYGSFLTDIGDEEGTKVQYENSKQLDPQNPAVWNNLANYYGEFSPVTNAFAYYAEAIKLDPNQPVYYQNFATTVYLFRKDAREFYNIDEQQVFDKALGLYRQAMKLDPDSLVLASDYAESYYGIKPLRTNDALVAWTNALKTTRNDVEREGVLIHLARVKIAAGMFDDAQATLDVVTNEMYADLKQRLIRSLADHKNPPPEDEPGISTNSPSAVAPSTVAATNALPASGKLPPLIVGPPTLREQKP